MVSKKKYHTSWEKVQLARHPQRPYTLDYLRILSHDFIELHGDRRFADDEAIIAGLATIGGQPFVVIGHQKGKNTQDNLIRNFGMAHPEGYRKALRVMRLAEKFSLPVLVFIDTPGAYPGIGAEERGQAEAIARNLFEMAILKTPIIAVVIGEGGSGGALGIGVADRVIMLENAIYSVISPEGCAAILWKDQSAAQTAARALKITAKDLLHMGIIDEIIPEPFEGAQSDYNIIAKRLENTVLSALKKLTSMSTEQLINERYNKFRAMGVFKDPVARKKKSSKPAKKKPVKKKKKSAKKKKIV
ncbi:MAG: acetyl-CoA carboxylase carboxyltransferase subunit alpha [bacterium]